MSMPAMHCATGPGSPAWIASTAEASVSSRKIAAGSSTTRPTTPGANPLETSRARCSAPTEGKLHHTSPQPLIPSSPTASTSTMGRSRIVPNEVRRGLATGQRKTCATRRAIFGGLLTASGPGRVARRDSTGISDMIQRSPAASFPQRSFDTIRTISW
jgi:hypothetical protein